MSIVMVNVWQWAPFMMLLMLAGGLVAHYLDPKHLSYIAGVGFIVIGAWTLWQGTTLT